MTRNDCDDSSETGRPAYDCRSWTASELAKIADIGAATASVHLKKLCVGGLIRVSPAGRHRYFRIANAEVAGLMEGMARIARTRVAATPGGRRASVALRECRMCYDHVAGRLGVAIKENMVRKEWLVEEEPWYRLTALGASQLGALGIPPVQGRACMDWSERKLHVGGELGRQLAQYLLDKKILRRNASNRALSVTPWGAETMDAVFGN